MAEVKIERVSYPFRLVVLKEIRIYIATGPENTAINNNFTDDNNNRSILWS